MIAPLSDGPPPASHGHEGRPPVEQSTPESAASDEAPEDAEARGLAWFLSERDVPCPHCGYNLRGGRRASCPECGKAIELGVLGTRRLGVGLAVVLGLVWVFLAAGMNGARQARSVYVTATQTAMFMPRVMVTGSAMTFSSTRGGQVTTWSSTNGSAPVVTVTPAPVAGGPPGVTISAPQTAPAPGVEENPVPSETPPAAPAPPAPAARAPRPGASGGPPNVTIGGPVRITVPPAASGLTRQPLPGARFSGFAPMAWATPPAPAGPVWGAVTVDEWALLAWWMGLALLALLGLLVLLVLRWRRKGGAPSRLAVRTMATWAGVLFLAYGGYHAQAFVRDVMTW